jgi:uncharacterized protein (TIGR02452 family)
MYSIGVTAREMSQETLRILEDGAYRAPSGAMVSIRAATEQAVAGSVLYRPAEVDDLVTPSPGRPRLETTDETTHAAARRLVVAERAAGVALLNYASARKPGGGFVDGARAQEEDVCRASALYPCLLGQHEHYEVNRRQRSFLYTDHVIFSPQVPFFRDAAGALLEAPFLASVITAAAPNAGEHLRREPHAYAELDAALRRRAGMVLGVARRHAARTVVLGAWGCGVFRNDAHRVADAFAHWIELLGGAFDRAVFAVPRGPNHAAFAARFAA